MIMMLRIIPTMPKTIPKYKQFFAFVGSSRLKIKYAIIPPIHPRNMGFTEDEKEKFERRVVEYCNSIQAINRIVTEDGKQKVGVFVVLDDKENINQQTVLDALNRVSELHEKTSRFLMKTF
jgi:hypothetical protein